MKKVLMIAYFFPPLGGSGVQRTLKFVKYLPESGLQPLVSTVREGHNFAHDQDLLTEIPAEAAVYRSSSLETLWLRALLEKIASLRKPAEAKSVKDESVKPEPPDAHEKSPESPIKAAPQAVLTEQPAAQASSQTPAKLSLKARLFRLIDDYLFIPDSKVRWLPFGFLKSLQVARQEQVDYLYSSSYPYTVHLIALLVHRFYRKPWIADFRDPWVGNLAMQKDLAFRRKLDAWMEQKVVANADTIIHVTPDLTAMYQKRYPQFSAKMITLTNGFDPADFSALTPVVQAKFTLMHTGIVAEGYDIETFSEGIRHFLKRRPEAEQRFQALFIGYVPPQHEALMKKTLGATVRFLPYMSHHDVLNYLSGAHLQFLTFDKSVEMAYSGKLFDYIGIEKPVLGLLPEGIAAQLIRERQLGRVAPLGDPEAVADALDHYYQAWLHNDTATFSTGSRARCSEFNRANLAQQLAARFLGSDKLKD